MLLDSEVQEGGEAGDVRNLRILANACLIQLSLSADMQPFSGRDVRSKDYLDVAAPIIVSLDMLCSHSLKVKE